LKNADLINHLEKLISISNHKRTGFSIGSTSNYSSAEDFYFTPIRSGIELIYTGVVVKNVESAIEISKVIDGKIEFIFVDAEKKINTSNYGLNDVGNIEKPLAKIIKKSKLLSYKGNDCTVRAMDSFLGTISPNLTGQLISIVGVSNIGIKIALDLVERGNQLNLISNDLGWANQVSNFINLVKLSNSRGKCFAKKFESSSLKNSTILIAATDRKNLIGLEWINEMTRFENTSQPLLIDVGKGCFKNEILQESDIDIYRLDIGIQLTSDLQNLVKIHDNLNVIKKLILPNGTRLVKAGYVGAKGDIIVDNPQNPKQIFGVCDGDGNLISLSADHEIYNSMKLF
jgi:hypothetical protein